MTKNKAIKLLANVIKKYNIKEKNIKYILIDDEGGITIKLNKRIELEKNTLWKYDKKQLYHYHLFDVTGKADFVFFYYY